MYNLVHNHGHQSPESNRVKFHLLNIISQLFQNLSEFQHVFRNGMKVFHGTRNISFPPFNIQRVVQDDFVTIKSKINIHTESKYIMCDIKKCLKNHLMKYILYQTSITFLCKIGKQWLSRYSAVYLPGKELNEPSCSNTPKLKCHVRHT